MLKAKGALDMASMNIDANEDQMLASHQHLSDGEEKKGRFPDYSNRKVIRYNGILKRFLEKLY